MSNYLAIATTSAVFSQKIYRALTKVKNLSSAPEVINKRPEKHDGQMVGAYLYLYNVEFNHTLRNNDLATRRADGTLIRQPQVALNLKYHVSFYGRENSFEAQRMMGATIIDLHAEPVITPAEIKQYLDASGPDAVLANSDLYKQQAVIKIEPVLLSLEDISKLWTTFFQAPHEHSLNYEISVILMESNLNIEKSLPAKSFSSAPDPGGIPEILKITPPYFEYPVEPKLIEISCKAANNSTKVRFEEAGLVLNPISASASILKVDVGDGLCAGINTVILVKERRENGVIRISRSEPARIIIQPLVANVQFQRIEGINTEAHPIIQLEIRPLPRIDQSVVLWLNGMNEAQNQDYQVKNLLYLAVDTSADALNKGDLQTLKASLAKAGKPLSSHAVISTEVTGSVWQIKDQRRFSCVRLINGKYVYYYDFKHKPTANEIAFSAEGIQAGQYLVRVQIDDQQYAVSLLTQNDDPRDESYGQYNGPMVTVS